MATDTREAGAPGELYRLLETTTDATEEEIVKAYKEKVKIYEETSNASKDKRPSNTVRKKFDEIVEPAKRDKKAKPNGEYFVQFNDGSVTVHLPVGSAKQWTEAIEAYYEGANGRRWTFMYERGRDARADGNTPVDRLEGLELVTAEWHAQVTSLQDVYDGYYNPKSAKEKGTLNHARNRYIAQHNALLTPRLSAAILHNKAINFHGLPGKNIPKDLFMEFLNRKAKDGLTRLGPKCNSHKRRKQPRSAG
ncbi:Hypp6854 [Branchiostoma lanceolatum]|uniref:Hypp6854 protein n=1 Tax=Branchiostoma lanceolatum TaxID=7740 RepID=A0A8K0E7N8_BRALA|nr:Hypp6854 [Branchiostoma lanceolatum]